MKAAYVRVVTATFVVPAAFVAAVLVLRSMWAPRLPEVVATHWGGSGDPDKATDLAALTGWATGITLALAAVAAVGAVALLRTGRGSHRAFSGLAAGVAVVPAAGLLGSVVAALDTSSWEQAGGPMLVVPLLLGSCLLAGVIAGLLAPAVAPRRADSEIGTESVGLAPGERAVWVGEATNGGLALLCVLGTTAITAVAILLSGAPAPWLVYLVPTGVGLLAALGICRVAVRVDASAVTIRMGVLGYPHRTIPLSEVTSATTEQLSVFGTGGLGVRLNPSGDVSFKCRAGEALVLTLRSNRRVYATVDHPADAAGLVNDLLRQDVSREG
ncbi:DUF1648 domain-containing protein [Saccharomonospora piscinae]|uniref:DUF1648 domain-containing protein n=1 Tax=Saccharomonospora piscinae TaxID=687388 RepID=A0A1V9A1V3_SACPI|nr:DUF1648 domain-containing protein [Saccharomonospora piscinae]OQO91028.1 DUF1648 domain-containing protein [Saccharomonospora piscinae]